MKKALAYWFSLLIVLLLSTMFLVSCKTKQPLQNTTKETSDKETTSDAQERRVINQAIFDEMMFKINKIYSSNPACDSLINYYRDELAKSLVASKTSGDNSYELKYNETLKKLQLLVKVGQTENKEVVKHTQTNNTYFKEIKVEVPVKLPLSWWENLFYRIGQICTSLAGLFIIYFLIKSKFQKFKKIV